MAMVEDHDAILDDLLLSDSEREHDTVVAATTTTPSRQGHLMSAKETVSTPATLATSTDVSMMSGGAGGEEEEEEISFLAVAKEDDDDQIMDNMDEEKCNNSDLMKDPQNMSATMPSNPPDPFRKADVKTFDPPSAPTPPPVSAPKKGAVTSSNSLLAIPRHGHKENPLSVFRREATKQQHQTKKTSAVSQISGDNRRRELTVAVDVPLASKTTQSWLGKSSPVSSSSRNQSRNRSGRRNGQYHALTVPVDVPLASKATQAWLGKIGGIPDSDYDPNRFAPPRSSTINKVNNRKRKLTIPLDVPLASKPTISSMGRDRHNAKTFNSVGAPCPRNVRNMNKSRRLNPNYLPSVGASGDHVSITGNTNTVVSSMVFPQQKHYHKHTIPEVVTIANKPTASWDQHLQQSSRTENLPYLPNTLRTPNGQCFFQQL